jgi:hypothetical protein
MHQATVNVFLIQTSNLWEITPFISHGSEGLYLEDRGCHLPHISIISPLPPMLLNFSLNTKLLGDAERFAESKGKL